jgi:hypothetical protein
MTTLPPSCADCLEIWEPQPPGTLRAWLLYYSMSFLTVKMGDTMTRYEKDIQTRYYIKTNFRELTYGYAKWTELIQIMDRYDFVPTIMNFRVA